VLQEYVDVTQWRLQKNIKPIGLVVQVSPLMGLFGTVLGMIQAFDVVAEQGLGKPELLASGMAVALLTTGFGLGVAIPCSIFHHFLIEKSNHISLRMYNMLHELALELCGRSEGSKK
jgi:biopolymer transport protein ExbB